MNIIEKNRNKQLAKNRQPKRGVLAKNVVVKNYTKKVRYDFDLNTQRLTIKANMYASVLAEFLDLWSTDKRLKLLKKNLQTELDKYCNYFAKNNFNNQNIEKTHNEIINIFIAELNDIDCDDELKLYCCVTHLTLIIIELLKVKVSLSSKKLDMSLISFMKELEKHIDKTRFNEVMNILDKTKALEVVKL